MEKQAAYKALIAQAKKSYPSWDDADDGKQLRLYWWDDCEEINLWTYWQGRGHLDAKIMLVGQDWGCPKGSSVIPQIQKANTHQKYDYLLNNNNPTDTHLIELFKSLGYPDIQSPCHDLFFTNFILGYRNKGLSGKYSKQWENHDRGYFAQLTNIICPKVILCLGRSTFEGVLSAFDCKPPVKIRNYNDYIESSCNPIPIALNNGRIVYVFALAHCGSMGTLNRNRKKSSSLDIQIEDWKKIIPYI